MRSARDDAADARELARGGRGRARDAAAAGAARVPRRARSAAGRGFYPPGSLVFNALRLTPLDDVRVVILGQDPYHGRGQAMGLCFSVPAGVTPPPSLRNIFTELGTDLALPQPSNGDLTAWATRGVLLLNSVLTVAPGSPASHAGKGWEQFTDRVIAELSARREGIVFLLWGRYAQQKGAVVDPRDTTSSRPRTPRRTRRRTGSSAAATSRARTASSRPTAASRSTGGCRTRLELDPGQGAAVEQASGASSPSVGAPPR